MALLPLLASGARVPAHAQTTAPTGLPREGAELVFLGNRDLPPYEFLDGDTPRGASVELAHAIGRVLGRPVEVRLMDLPEAQARLRAGEGHALTLLEQSPARELHLHFSQPTLPFNLAFFVRADQERAFATRDRPTGWRIAVTRAGLPRELLAVSHPDALLATVEHLAEGLALLRSGAVDALAGNAWAIRHLVHEQHAIGIAELPPFARRHGNIAVREGDTLLLAEIDRALSQLKESGAFDAILDRWSQSNVHLLPDWTVRAAAAAGATALFAVVGLAALTLRLRARTAALAREIEERNRAEAALAQRDSVVAAIGESTPDLVFAKDAEGRFLYANPATLALLGRVREEVEGHGPRDWLLDQEHAHAIEANDRRVMARGIAETFEEQAADAGHSGAVRIFTATKAPLRDAAGRVAGIVGVARDVTEERAATAALAEAKARLDVILDGAGLGAWHWRVPADHTDYDDRWLAMLGYAPGGIPRHFSDWRALIHPDDRAMALAALQAHLDGTAPHYECEYRLLHRAGGWVWVLDRGRVVERDVEGHPVVVTGMAMDITSRKRAEEALAASQERLALASAAAKLGVWDVDIQARTAIVNREFRRLYGLPPDDDAPLAQQEWMALIHPEDRDRMRRAADAAHQGGGEYREEFRIVRADTGEVRWISVRGSAVGAPGQVRRMAGVCHDITERRQEQERQMLLAREVDHRARNVLAVVHSVVRLTRAEDPRDFAKAVEGRVAALARAHTLLSRDRWTGADLPELVREELAAYDHAAVAELSGPALRLDAAAVQPLSMVMHELATNAAKYGALSLPGGRVAIDWSLLPALPGEAPRLRLRWLERDGPPVLGPPVRRGFGSSLLAATLRSQLGGTIEQHWNPGGLCCEIELPGSVLAAAASAPPAPSATADPSAEPGAAPLYGKRVLLVEDEPLVALALQAALQDAGCTVRGPFATLAEAQRAGSEEGLDAAVMDVNLRGGGLSLPLGEHLAARRVPVVYVTGLSSFPAGRPLFPGETLLNKPVREAVLVATLARAIAARAPATVA